MSRLGTFCECCGETHSSLLIKSDKRVYCRNCGPDCPAAEEHKMIKFVRIGHFVFANAAGMSQAITVRNFTGHTKTLTMEVNFNG